MMMKTMAPNVEAADAFSANFARWYVSCGDW